MPRNAKRSGAPACAPATSDLPAMDLRDRVVLVTGVKRVGSTVAEALARRGMDVALSYNSSAREAEEAAKAIRAAGRRALVLQADLSRPDDCQRLVDTAARELGRLDALVNMASIYRSVPFDDLDLAAWRAALDVDLQASFLCARAAVPHLRQQGGGRIVNFADWVAASRRPRYTGYLAYYIAKAGVIALTEALALELAADQILVNAVAPGPVLAPGEMTAAERQAVEAATPVGRWGGAAEVALAVAYLLETDFVTGETIRVDGGRHVK
jgi:NAD(P)-dependent dehydrogenase (short-subunit alcohol dehydrogenase family)